ncbi:MAG: biotin--[acetyl-CoA-carboxylase] ligase [Flavobacteriales bacterium]|nr:biotin--[acetyl-CoA-carboxylase] ligase [Flavobacteriales bacterium]MCX7769319.1 biotin--[acetyl-CoA-carboxylase] ligase [Flavobacteriales bacterium]MDW8410726.1 biotin--[acetyl-CoA-carboxylase] ligase [Flavobacteriales bacterium]
MRIVKHLILDVTGSTNDAVRSILDSIAQGQALALMAYDQVSGRGQKGRSWYSTPHQSLLMSLGIRDLKIEKAGLFALHAYLAAKVAEFWRTALNAPVALKWPNDLYWKGLKLGGMLMEASSRPPHQTDVVWGLGVNLNQESFPSFLPHAVSAFQISGKSWHVETVFFHICQVLEEALGKWASLSEEEALNVYLEKLDGISKVFEYRHLRSGHTFIARLSEILPDGRAIFILEDGSRAGPFRHDELERLLSPCNFQISSGEI